MKKNHTLFQTEIYHKEYISGEGNLMEVHEVVFPPRAVLTWHSEEKHLVLILLEGSLAAEGKLLTGPAVMLFPAGMKTEIQISDEEPGRGLVLLRKAEEKFLEFHAAEYDTMPWEAYEKHGVYQFDMKKLLTLKQAGFHVQLTKYPEGYYLRKHVHPCSHGIYVLEGILKTEKGFYGPGSFLWSPEGEPMEHGAPKNIGCTSLFITDKDFDIDYID